MSSLRFHLDSALRGFGLAQLLLWCTPAGALPAQPSPEVAWQVVSPEEMVDAMRSQIGYDPTVTTNAARFQGYVLLELARRARDRDPDGPPLFLDHAEWFESFLAATGTTLEDAPTHALMGYRHKQDIGIEYRADRVIHDVVEGPPPELALSVLLWWQRTPDAPDRYSYVDSTSTPRLKITNRSVKTYRLLDYGDMIAYDEVDGLTGRPTSGALGLLFRVMGDGTVKWSRMAIAEDGVTVARGHAEKGPFSVTNTATVYPDGRSEKGVPHDRPDLRALEERLRAPLELDYAPLGWFERSATGSDTGHR